MARLEREMLIALYAVSRQLRDEVRETCAQSRLLRERSNALRSTAVQNRGDRIRRLAADNGHIRWAQTSSPAGGLLLRRDSPDAGTRRLDL